MLAEPELCEEELEDVVAEDEEVEVEIVELEVTVEVVFLPEFRAKNAPPATIMMMTMTIAAITVVFK